MKGPFDPNTKQTFENGKILALTFEGKTIFGKTLLTKFVWQIWSAKYMKDGFSVAR